MPHVLGFMSIAIKQAIQIALLLGIFYSAIHPAHADDAEDIALLLENYLEVNKISGGVIAVHAPDLNITIASGIANRQTKTVMTGDKRFYLASLGKTIVAAAILDAVAKSEIGLDSKVVELLPDLEGLDKLDRIETIIVAQLLNHSSGLTEYLTDAFWNASVQNPSKKWSSAEALTFAHDTPATFRTGTNFQYNNTNYVLLGAILENLDGSLPESLAKRVFAPSGMATATVGAEAKDKSLARGYDAEGDDYSELIWLSPLGDGPVVGTVSDLKKFVDATFRDKTLLPTKTLKQMLKGSKQDKAYGLGIGVERDDFGLWYGHAGLYDGFEADFRYYPKHDLTIIYALNGNQIEDGSLSDILAEWYLGE